MNLEQRGKFISIEGVEGAGKSTVIQFIKKFLHSMNVTVVLTREPGGTPFAEKIRDTLLDPTLKEKINPVTELLLMFACRSQHLQEVIRPALELGSWVISDRYIDASYAYQGGGRGVLEKQIKVLDQFVVADCYPDLTLLLDLPSQLGLERASLRGNKDRIEQEDSEFFDRVREVYLRRAQAWPKRIKMIDAKQNESEVENQVSTILKTFISEHK